MPLRRSATVLGFAFTCSGTIPLSASLRISRNATTDGTGQQAVFNANGNTPRPTRRWSIEVLHAEI
jgi:hypothetical protein